MTCRRRHDEKLADLKQENYYLQTKVGKMEKELESMGDARVAVKQKACRFIDIICLYTVCDMMRHHRVLPWNFVRHSSSDTGWGTLSAHKMIKFDGI